MRNDEGLQKKWIDLRTSKPTELSKGPFFCVCVFSRDTLVRGLPTKQIHFHLKFVLFIISEITVWMLTQAYSVHKMCMNLILMYDTVL